MELKPTVYFGIVALSHIARNKKTDLWLGMVAHTYNPHTLGRTRRAGSHLYSTHFGEAQVQWLTPILHTLWGGPGAVAHTYNPHTLGRPRWVDHLR